MLEVFKQILLFPAPIINFVEFFDLIEDINNPETFKKKEADRIVILKKNTHLKTWYDFTVILFEFNELIYKQWKSVTNKVLGADEVNSVISALFPNDLSALKTLNSKILKLIDMGCTSRFLGFFLVSLSVVLNEKIENFKHVSVQSRDKEIDLIVESIEKADIAAENERCRPLLLPIKNACLEYKTFLYEMILDYFRQKFPELQKSYFSSDIDHDEAFKKLFNDFQTRNIKIVELLKDENIRILFEKYGAVLAMYYTVMNEKPTSLTLTTFAETYFQHKSLLIQKPVLLVNPNFIKNSMSYITTTRMVEIFKPSNPEDSFFSIAEPFCTKIRIEDEKFLQLKSNSIIVADEIAGLKP